MNHPCGQLELLITHIQALLRAENPPPLPFALVGTPGATSVHDALTALRRHLCKAVQGHCAHCDGDGALTRDLNALTDKLAQQSKLVLQKEEALLNLARSLQYEAKRNMDKRIAVLNELKSRESEFRYQAQHDPLTGVLNRRSFTALAEAKLKSALAINKPCCLCMMDIDHFKGVNDRFGHAAGDRALKHVVLHSQACLRQSDIMGRYGGEEFIFFFADADATQGLAVAERLRARLEANLFRVDATEKILLTASFGLCAIPPGCAYTPDRLQSMCNKADAAMYAAKLGGRNRVEIAPLSPA